MNNDNFQSEEISDDEIIDQIIKILNVGGDLNIKYKVNYGANPLHIASKNGRLDIVKKLINKGADVNANNNVNETPLHDASKNGHLEVVRELIYEGANVNDKNDNNKTPLYLASKNGHLEVVKILVKNGAFLNELDMFNSNPNIYKNEDKIIEYLSTAKQMPETRIKKIYSFDYRNPIVWDY